MHLHTSMTVLVLIGALFSPSGASALTAEQKNVLEEVKRELTAWADEKRYDDIKLIKAHEKLLMEQVKAGEIDLQAILDEHHYKHKDGKFYGQKMPEQTATPSGSGTEVAPVARAPSARAIEPAVVGKQNTPITSYAYLSSRWVGFPMQLTFESEVAYYFPNGNTVYCANWDPRYLDPTPESVGQSIDECEVKNGRPDEDENQGFESGQRIDIRFGNVSASGIDGVSGSSSRISGSTLRMTNDGRITIGTFNAFSVSSEGNGAGGGNRKRKLVGSYALDGHLITIVTDSGEKHVGFISWDSDSGSNQLDHVYINGEHFWNRDK